MHNLPFNDIRHESMESWIGDRHYQSSLLLPPLACQWHLSHDNGPILPNSLAAMLAIQLNKLGSLAQTTVSSFNECLMLFVPATWHTDASNVIQIVHGFFLTLLTSVGCLWNVDLSGTHLVERGPGGKRGDLCY